MSKYLVTGAAGFIASRVCEALLDEGHQVVGVDNLNDAYDPRIKEYRLNLLLEREGFCFRKADISDRQQVDSLEEDVQRASAVINLAARAGVRSSVEDPWLYYATNLTGTLNLLELCRRTGIQKFLLASTSSVYGENAPIPTPESADSDRPLQPYAASKKAAEILAYSYHYLHGLDVSVVRYFTVYGPAGRPDMVMFRFCQWVAEGRTVYINGDGTQSRGFTHVDDIARGTILALQPVGYEVFNLGGHEQMTINELLALMERLIGKKAQIVRLPRHPADMLTNYADVTKARQMLGWEPKVGLHEGVSSLVDWYMDNRELASQVLTP
ncbi:MAG TPA: SDR family NAD(P)-dependent oxidoreductase [Anaerolineaceae bacterium]|nr:SDR family NAD(P)-dependent oxidoreductase [Anaerolineaceae bacterium]